MIVFGHNNFKIRSISPREIGIPETAGQQKITIEVRQRYFHLFWIPFFPIGKIYGIRKQGDSNLYEVPPQIKNAVLSKVDVKTPWYSYSIFIIALIIGSGMWGNNKISSIERENNFYEEQAVTKMLVKYPTTGDYYKFIVKDCSEDNNSRYNTPIIVKVTSYDATSIEFSSAYINMLDKEQYAYSLSTEIEKNNDYKYNSFSLKKEDIIKCLTKEYRSYGNDEAIEDLNWCYVFKDMERQKLDDLNPIASK